VIHPALLLVALGAALALMTVTWALSLVVRDASIADIAWGPVFALIAWLSVLESDSLGVSLPVAILVSAWAARLALHIALRHKGEDPRYAAMRKRRGAAFPIWSLASVFWLQAVLATVVALPVIAATGRAGSSIPLIAGFAIAAAGLAFEAVADIQLTRFRGDPAGAGQVLDTGLWRYSRHPNYFGESVFWWGMWLGLAASGATPVWTVIGPVLITGLLIRVSGVTLLERSITSRRPGYADYVQRTSAFVPRRPNP
jgi:steroid 5-alpha reductase family enzyme